MLKFSRAFVLAALSVALLAPSTFCQQPQQDMKIDAAYSRRVIKAALTQIQEKYAFADEARKIQADLGAKLERGEYDSIISALELTRSFNKDLRSVTQDKHLNFSYNDTVEDLNVNYDSPAEREKQRIEEAKSNFGINAVEVLPGNVAYLDYRTFEDPDFGAESLASAFALIANSQALIIDLRNNGGGAMYGVSFLMSYFVAPRPVKVSELYYGPDHGIRQIWSLPFVPGPRYLDKPVYVLTSRKTFSAAEGFTFSMKRLHLATIVGENTGGGANPAMWVAVDPHFAIQVPIAHPADLTQTWETVGITPDVSTPAERSLDTAKLLAWKALLARTKDPDEAAQLRDLIAAAEKH